MTTSNKPYFDRLGTRWQRITNFWRRLRLSREDARQVRLHQTEFGNRIRPKKHYAITDETLFVDPFALEKSLHAFERGAQDGKDIYPPADATKYDKFHRDLLARVEQIQFEQTSNRVGVLQKYSGDMASVRLDKPDEVLKPVFYRAAKVDLELLFSEWEPRILNQRINLGIATRAYSHFRTVNNRTEEAHEPSILRKTIGVIGLSVAAAVEYKINQTVLSYNNDQGTWGVITFAILICVANLVVPFLLGLTAGRGIHLVTFRNNKHRRSRWSYMWWFILLSGIAFILAVNVMFAALREEAIKSGTMSSVISDGISQLVAHPFAWLGDPQSLFMFVAGLVMALLAFHEGVSGFSDKYPGYLEVRKKRDRAWSIFNKMRQDLQNAIHAHFDNAREYLMSIVDDNKQYFQYFQEQMRQFQELRSRHEIELERVEVVANMVAQSYREANLAHRGGAEVPTYFNEPVRISRDFGFWTTDVDAVYDTLTRDMQALEDAAVKYAEQLVLTEEVRQTKLQRLIETVEGKAIERINQFAPVLTETQARVFEF